MLNRLLLGGLVVLLCACTPTLPAPAAPRTGSPVAASFGKTWDATIDAFADRGISIETLDRASGLIVPRGRTWAGSEQQALIYADCGRDAFGTVTIANSVKYNVIVRGDSTRSTIQVRAFYEPLAGGRCESRGVFEADAEAGIRARAEGRPAVEDQTLMCSKLDTAVRDGNNLVATVNLPGAGGCSPHKCTYRDGALSKRQADAIADCKAEALRSK